MRTMALFHKQYFSLNSSVSKNILVCLKRKEGKFSPLLHIFGDKDGVALTLDQFTTLVREKNNVLAYMDGGVQVYELDLSDKISELIASGRKGHCNMILIRQVEKLSGRVNIICLAKITFVRLMELSKLILHLLTRLEKSVPECEKLLSNQNDVLGVNEHGLDLCALQMELSLFQTGVKDCIFKV